MDTKKAIISIFLFVLVFLWSFLVIGQDYQSPQNVSITNDGIYPVDIEDVGIKKALDVNVIQSVSTGTTATINSSVTGTVFVSGGSISVSNPTTTVSISSMPSVTVNQGTDPWNISGSVTATISNPTTTVGISSMPTVTVFVSNPTSTVTVSSGTVTVLQGTTPFVTAGTDTITSLPSVTIMSMPSTTVLQGTTPWTTSTTIGTGTGTLTAPAQAVTLNLRSDSTTIGILITGTWTGQIELESSVDGVTFISHDCQSNTGTVTNATAGNGTFICQTAGFTVFRTRASALSVGSAVVTIKDTGRAHIVNALQAGTWSTQNSLSSSFTYSQISVSNTATLIKAANTSRKSIVIRNQGTVDMYIGDSGVTTTTGLLIKILDTITLDRTSSAIYGIVSSSTTTAGYLEE